MFGNLPLFVLGSMYSRLTFIGTFFQLKEENDGTKCQNKAFLYYSLHGAVNVAALCSPKVLSVSLAGKRL